MTDITLNTVSSGYNLGKINDNFETVEDVINDDVLHLEGGNNVLRQDIDANGKRLINLPAPLGSGEPLRKGDITTDATGATVQYVDDSLLITIQRYTLAEAIALTTAVIGQVVQITDRADGQFEYIAATTNNTFNSIDATGSGLTLSLKFDSVVDVKQFGAVADSGGVSPFTGTDDTAAIQAAIDTTKTVYIPAGSYRIDSTLFYGTLQEIYGDGNKSDLKSNVIAANVLENGVTIFNSHLSHFRISGNGSETGGLRVTGTFEGFRLDDIIVSGVGGSAFWFTDSFVVDCFNIWSEGNEITTNGLLLEGCTNMNFYGSHFRESIKTGAGVTLQRGTAGNYVINFNGCLFESNFGDGMRLQDCNAVNLDTCYFEANNNEYNNDTAARANHISVYDIDTLGTKGGDFITIKNTYFNPNYVEHYISVVDVSVNPIVIENCHEQNFGILPFQSFEYSLDLDAASISRASAIGMNPINFDVNGRTDRLTLSNYTLPLLDDVRLVYFDVAGTAIEGDVPATISTTRTMQGGALKSCVFEIDSIDTSGIVASRLIGVVVPVSRFGTGPYTSVLDHTGTSGTGVLQFFLKSDDTGDVFKLTKGRLVASGSTIGRADDLVGVTGLDGSVTYF